jgi:anti-sigma-K factor RskA
MTDALDDPDREMALAAEYALGLLDGPELDEARRRRASEPDFAREVARWRGRLAPLHSEIDEIDPPADLWDRVDAAIRLAGAANDNERTLHHAVTVWRSATAVMTAVAASLAMVLILQPHPTQQPRPRSISVPASAPMVAMVGDQKATTLMVSWEPSTRQLVMAVAAPAPTDVSHSRELWVIPAGGKPHSLGLLPAGNASHRRLADAIADLLQQGATIAISVEPRGGSPTGAPTGPVVATGALSRA